jgi:hypothetical protein
MFIGTALAKPLLKIGTMLRKAKLFHFIQLACVRIFMLFGDFSPFRPERVQTLSRELINNKKVDFEKDVDFLFDFANRKCQYLPIRMC